MHEAVVPHDRAVLRRRPEYSEADRGNLYSADTGEFSMGSGGGEGGQNMFIEGVEPIGKQTNLLYERCHRQLDDHDHAHKHSVLALVKGAGLFHRPPECRDTDRGDL